METLFNFNRFWLLVRKHDRENRKLFLLSIAVMILPTVIVQLINSNSPDSVFEIYSIFLCLIGGVYTGMIFNEWDNKARAASTLLLPATAFEKIALILFFAIVVFIPVYTVVFNCSWFIISKITHPDLPYSFIDQYKNMSPLPAFAVFALTPYLFLQSMFLLFSVWFKKRQILKAFGCFIIVFYAEAIFFTKYIRYLTGLQYVSGTGQLLFFPTDFYYSDGGHLRITSHLILIVSIVVLLITTLLFYLASYFKLKEKEI